MGGFTGSGEGPEVPGGHERSKERDPRLGAFAHDCQDRPVQPDARLAQLLSDLSGPDWRCGGATDDEVFGIAGRWAALEAHVFAAKLGVLRELIRRRPRQDAADGRVMAGDVPVPWERGLEHEVAAELRISLAAALKLLYLAWALEARLPGIGQAVAAGQLDPGRTRMIVDETDVLQDAGHLAEVEAMILAGLDDCKTWAALQRLVAHAVCTVDPGGATRRREHAEREKARIAFWRERSGAAALAGYSLPPDEALAGRAGVERRAQWYRKEGIRERIDFLRIMAFLDLLSEVPAHERVTGWKAEHEAAGAPGDAQHGDEEPGGDDPGEAAGNGGTPPRPGSPASATPGTGSPASGAPEPDRPASGTPEPASSPAAAGPALPAMVNLTLPLATQMRLAERAGEAWGLGALDPSLVRRLAEAAARSWHSKFCVTIVNEEGHAVAHGCCKPVRNAGNEKAAPGPAPPGDPESATFAPCGRRGNAGESPGGHDSWVLTLPGATTPFTVDPYPIPVGECDHRYESPGHDPGRRLRHLVQVRDGACSFPACSRHARETDFEHAVPYERGGRTCACNCHSCSRACHQVKQRPGWSVAQEKPGWHTWTTPSGRSYAQGPWRYPA